MNCVLCNSVDEENRMIRKTKQSFCIVTKWPLKPGHVIIMPKRHVVNFNELDEKEIKDLMDLVDDIKDLLSKKFEESIVIHTNTGVHRTEQHLHIHLVPSKGGIRDFISEVEGVPKLDDKSEKEMQEIRDLIIGKPK